MSNFVAAANHLLGALKKMSAAKSVLDDNSILLEQIQDAERHVTDCLNFARDVAKMEKEDADKAK